MRQVKDDDALLSLQEAEAIRAEVCQGQCAAILGLAGDLLTVWSVPDATLDKSLLASATG
jgi:hypothetical protein